MPELSSNAMQIASKRYFIRENEGWENLSKRVGYEIGRIEKDKKYIELFSEMVFNMDFIPAGRVLRNSGRPAGSLLNCYAIMVGDSIREIAKWKGDSLILWSEGGGVGCNISSLRPEDAPILGKGGNSSGPISFLKASDGDANTIKSGGSRRAAGLALLMVTHPDIVKFINAKTVDGILKNYNISVGITEDFIDAVETDSEWTYKFNQKDYGTVDAREIWNLILENMIKYAEPGLIHWDNLRENNSYYFSSVVCTNPCGEAALGNYEACDLGSLVLTNFVTNINTNWKKLKQTIELAVRFLDNVLDINKYVLNEVEVSSHAGRRIGIGVMGLAEYLFAKKIKYGSDKAIYEIEKLMRFIRDSAYEASIKLAIEKGAFPKFDTIPYSKSRFIRKLPASLRMDIKSHGIRNVSTMAIAPTGTISLLSEVTPSTEPLFAKAYVRKDEVGERYYIHPLLKDIVKEGKETPEWFVDSYDIKPKDHFEVQVAVQKYTDGAVSKTINTPKGTTAKQLDKLMLENINDLKGVTVYVDGSREGQIINKLNDKEIQEAIKSGKVTTEMAEEDVTCAKGTCDI